jgi:thiamine-phosphate pyrophosphorylase
LLINDDLALALAVNADGVHLGAADGESAGGPAGAWRRPPCSAPRVMPISNVARAAVSAGADYVAFGAVYPSATKPLARPAPLSLFTRCRSELRVPACAIGGITVDRARPLLAAGADLLAVISDFSKRLTCGACGGLSTTVRGRSP